MSGFEETLPKDGLSGAQYAELTATAKAVQVAEQAHDVDLVIGADTVVELNGQILEKPEDEDDACRMLQQLSGSQHRVHTGVALVLPKKGGRLVNFTTSTLVAFDNLSTQAIEAYVSSGEPMGKAGAYGIQGKAGVFVKRIDGCYFNVVGLPLNSLSNVIDDLIAEGAL